MKALIIGSGVAGTVAAMALQKAGWGTEVYEAYDRSDGLDQGVYLTVAVNGLDALRAIQAHGVVTTAGFPTGRMEFFGGTGKRLGAISMGPTLDDGTVTHTVRRSDLYAGLRAEAVARGIPIEHGKRLVHASSRPTGLVVARFADGTTAEGDLLIGADGVHSITRSLVDPAAPGPRYTGLGNTGGFTRHAEVDAQAGDYRLIWGRNCFFGYVVSPEREIWWFANPPRREPLARDEIRHLTTSDRRKRLIDLLAADATPGARIVAATDGEIPLSNQYDLPSVPTWHYENMVIIGDAAHAVSPSSGQGCSLACEDAVVLAQCLRDRPSVPHALDEYDRLRRGRVERVVKWGSGMNNTKKQGLVGRALRDLALPMILRRAAKPEEEAKMAWMFNHHIDWEQTSVPA